MVQTLNVTCPHCQQTAEIFLSTNACVIILNCPSCCSPIMYFDQKIFILSQSQVEAIKNKARSSSMMNLLKKMTRPEEQPVPKLHAHHRAAAEQCTPQIPAHSTVRSGDRKIHIGSDDITNLRIELGLCNDVLEFIDRM
jgi:septum formation inhibitor MinC